MAERFGLIGDSFDGLVQKQMQSSLAQFCSNLRSSSVKSKKLFLDDMDNYVRLSKDENAKKTPQFDKMETILLFDIFHIINKRPYTEGDSFVFAKQTLQDYASLSDEKRSLFRQNLVGVRHKAKSFLSSKKQKEI